METIMFVELVDKEGRVISRQEVANDAFPLTVRLEGDRVVTRTASPVPGASRSRWWERLRSPGGELLVSAVTVGIFAASISAKTYADKNGADALGVALITYTGLLVWAGLWALGGRIAHNPARFRDQLLWTCLATLALMVGHEIFMWGEFLFPASYGVGAITGLLVIALVLVGLYGHLTIASRLPARARRKAVGIVAVVIAAMSGLGAYAMADKFDTDLDYSPALKPLDARLVPSESPDQFMREIGRLRKHVDKAAKKQ